MRRHQGAKIKHFDVSDVIYHKFSHGAVSYTLNWENVNVMLEFTVIRTIIHEGRLLETIPKTFNVSMFLLCLDLIFGYLQKAICKYVRAYLNFEKLKKKQKNKQCAGQMKT